MKRIVPLLFALALPLAAGRVKFADDRYSLEFPAGWKDAEDSGGALLARANAAGDALFAVNRLPLPENAAADLEATARAIIAGMKKDLGIDGEPELREGMLDGLKARFATLVPDQAADAAAAPRLGHFLVLVDAGREVVILQATLALPLEPAEREACLGIIRSFRRELPAPAGGDPPADKQPEQPASGGE